MASRWLEFFQTLCVFAVFCAITFCVQRTAGAPAAAFGGFPDEPAHYIGGLITHDYLEHGLGTNPISFVQDYYVHVPFFALGVWPPFFYLLEGFWMIVFGCGRIPVLWMGAVTAALIPTILFIPLRRQFDKVTAAAASAIFLFVPVVQWSACLIMADLTCSLFALIAILFCARFLEKRQKKDALLFGFFCGIALLTKNSTYFVLFIPPMVIAASWRWDLVRETRLWAAGVLAVGIYAPWLVLSKGFLLLGTYGLRLPGFWGTQWEYAATLWKQTHLLLPAAALGIILMLYRRKMTMTAWCMLMALPAISIGIYLARVPVQPRLLTLSYISLIFFVVQLCTLAGRYIRAALLAALIIFGALNWAHFRRPPVNRIAPVVADLYKRDLNTPGAVLVPSGEEGPWIAEFAQAESRRPERIFLRPTKLFGEEDWNGSRWHPYYASVSEIREFFSQLPVKYCILGSSMSKRHYPHDKLLEAAVANDPQEWQLVLATTTGTGSGYRVYENTHWEPASEPLIYAELNRRLLQKFRGIHK